MARFVVFLAGLLFGAGVTVGGMVNPLKVQNFMDLSSRWDPTLAFVMAAALAVTFVGYRLAFQRPSPFFAGAFRLPTNTGINARLLAGAVAFGLGWGLTGYCPGPAVAGLVFGNGTTYLFVVAMVAGYVAANRIHHFRARVAAQGQSQG